VRRKRTGTDTGTGAERRPPRAAPEFWRELFWFAAIGLAGYIATVSLLPERRQRLLRVLEVEAGLRSVVEDLQEREEEYRAAILAVENDPFFRGEVFRRVLGVKRAEEEFLQGPPVEFR